jgi:hypothetical protein
MGSSRSGDGKGKRTRRAVSLQLADLAQIGLVIEESRDCFGPGRMLQMGSDFGQRS